MPTTSKENDHGEPTEGTMFRRLEELEEQHKTPTGSREY
ncbi:hypothetical protein SEA_PSONYX_50 [Corynebacterium phage PSonyx]|nr:hypothetical protein SEA_PSONYX_50 [Corynebacterium phage PSonyx]